MHESEQEKPRVEGEHGVFYEARTTSVRQMASRFHEEPAASGSGLIANSSRRTQAEIQKEVEPGASSSDGEQDDRQLEEEEEEGEQTGNVGMYECVRKCIVRKGVEMDSSKSDKLEVRPNDAIRRTHFN